MNKITCRVAVEAAALALVTQATWASAALVQSSVSLANFSYKLIDLNTTDGVKPTLTSLPESNFWTYAIPDESQSIFSDGTERQAGNQFDASSASVALPNGQGSAAKNGNSQHADTLLTSDALTSHTNLQGYSLRSQSGVSTEGSFTLSAHTKMVISGDLLLTTQIDSAAISALPANSDGRTLNVNSAANFSVLLSTNAGIQLESNAGKVNADQFKTYQMWLWDDTAAQSFNASGAGVLSANNNVPNGTIQLEITNNSDAQIAFSLNSYSYAQAFTTTALPEPGSWLLMGLGLMGVLAAAGRHRHHGAPACAQGCPPARP